MRRPLRAFRNLTSVDGRLGFYTQETKETIPGQPGCYAWFLPLWIYQSDLNKLMETVGEIYGHEQEPEKVLNANFTWHSISLRVRSEATARPTLGELGETWDQIVAEDESKAALQQLLLEASLLMPPLYVGRTANLKRRYEQHLTKMEGKNDFHTRFTECVAELGLDLKISDLLFVCVKTHDELNRILDEFENVELLVEQILMQFCRPPFSLR